MARHLIQKPLIPQDENLDIHRKRSFAKGKPTGSKLETKKLGAGFGSRKVLGDITNKSSLPNETSLKRKSTPKEEEPNISEEMFLHDHKKCIESQKAAVIQSFWDTVLPGCVSMSPLETQEMRSTKNDLDIDSQCLCPEPVEIPMSEFSDIFKSSPLPSPHSPVQLDSPPMSPLAMEFGPVEFMLREDDDP